MTTEDPHDPATWRDDSGDFAVYEDHSGPTGDWRTRQTDDYSLLRHMMTPPNVVWDRAGINDSALPYVIDIDADGNRTRRARGVPLPPPDLFGPPYPPDAVLEDRSIQRYPADFLGAAFPIFDVHRTPFVDEGTALIVGRDIFLGDLIPAPWWKLSGQMVLLLLSLVALGAIATWIILAAVR